jgi:DNA-binding response OmpR family regulator
MRSDGNNPGMLPLAQHADQVYRHRLLIVEDDVRLCKFVKRYLETMGYAVSVEHTGPAGLACALKETFHAVILDVMLPGMDGFEVLQHIRTKSNVPVLMLTGRYDEADRIVGFEMGADDYVPKTCSTRELLARLRSMLRRSQLSERGGLERRVAALTIGTLVIDAEARSAMLESRLLDLTRVEFDLLLTLAGSAGRVRTREQLVVEIAGRDFEGFDRSIDVHVSSLRRKLGDDSKSPRWIETVRGVGYLFLRQ